MRPRPPRRFRRWIHPTDLHISIVDGFFVSLLVILWLLFGLFLFDCAFLITDFFDFCNSLAVYTFGSIS
jgi:hypothetical protein